MSPILVELRASSSEFMAKMKEARHEVTKLGTEGSAHYAKVEAVGKRAFLGLTAGAAALGAESLKMAGDFQEGMTTLVTGAGESERNLGMVGEGIKRIAVATGSSTKQLIDGAYMIESAGYRGASGLKVLEAAAQGAKVGGAQMGDVANALTSALHAYGLSADQAVPVTNSLIATVANGKMHMQDLADSLAKVIPAAAAVKVPLQQVEAAMASMTASGTPAADAATYLRQVLVSFSAPSKASAAALEGLGTSATALSSTLSTQGLYAAMKLVSDHMHQHLVPGTAAWTQALESVAGGKKQMMAVLELMPHLKEFGANLTTITERTNASKTAVDGWDLVQKDFNHHLDVAKARAEVLGITIGQKLIPVVSAATKFLTDHKNVLTALVAVIGGALVAAMTAWIARLVIGAATQTIFAARVLVANLAMGLQIARIYAVSAASAVWTGVQWLLNASLLGFPLVWIVGALVALVAGIVYAYKHFGWFRDAVNTVWAALKVGLAAVVSFFRSAWDTVVAIFRAVVGWIGGHVRLIMGVLFLLFPVFIGLIAAVKAVHDNWRTVWGAIVGALNAAWSVMRPVFGFIVNLGLAYVRTELGVLRSVWSSVWGVIQSVVTSVWSVLRPIFDRIASGIGGVIKAAGSLGGVVKAVGGVASGIGKALGFADGTNYAPGGLAMVGERGPELMYVPRGAQVIPNHRLAGLGGGGGESVVHVNVHVDGEVVARAVQRANKRYAVRNGRNLFATA